MNSLCFRVDYFCFPISTRSECSFNEQLVRMILETNCIQTTKRIHTKCWKGERVKRAKTMSHIDWRRSEWNIESGNALETMWMEMCDSSQLVWIDRIEFRRVFAIACFGFARNYGEIRTKNIELRAPSDSHWCVQCTHIVSLMSV